MLLSTAALMFHGGLTHLFNDYTDYQTGTDARSPAILSGGSRVIQNGILGPEAVWQLGKWLAIIFLAAAVVMILLSRYDFTIFLLTGVWAAASYSLPPFRFSYRPFLGEWLSLFPAIFVLGLAGPWLMLESIPLWAVHHALINSFVCMAWVMVHHIPDMEADQQAVPKKCTTVVWFREKFGIHFAKLPAILYFLLAAASTVWLGFDRLFPAIFVWILLAYALYVVVIVDPEDIEEVTNCEKILLVLAVVIAGVLGVF